MAAADIDLTGHLDAQRLSSLVDARADPDATGHVEACRRCQERLAAWRAVRDRVAALDDDRAQRMLDARRQDVVGAVTARISAGRPRSGGRARRLWLAIAGGVLVATAIACLVVAASGI